MSFALAAGAGIPILLGMVKEDVRAAQTAALRSVAFILPRSREERTWFAAMCIVVGVCEEIIFRGFLIRFLALPPITLGMIGAVCTAAFIFGIDHGYQGWMGVLTTAFLALVFGLLFLGTGSLLVPMILHVLLDLRILLMLPAAPEPASLSGTGDRG